MIQALSLLSPALVTAVSVQVLCQAFKVVYYSLRDRRPRWAYFVQPGGAPSGHAAFVTALAVSIAQSSGLTSDAFAVACVFGSIVIHDALRLRGAVESHARLLNRLGHEQFGERHEMLSERIGHSLGEIAWGVLAGAGLALLT